MDLSGRGQSLFYFSCTIITRKATPGTKPDVPPPYTHRLTLSQLTRQRLRIITFSQSLRYVHDVPALKLYDPTTP